MDACVRTLFPVIPRVGGGSGISSPLLRRPIAIPPARSGCCGIPGACLYVLRGACVRAIVGFDVRSLKTFHLFLVLLCVCRRAWEFLGEMKRLRAWICRGDGGRDNAHARTHAREVLRRSGVAGSASDQGSIPLFTTSAASVRLLLKRLLTHLRGEEEEGEGGPRGRWVE